MRKAIIAALGFALVAPHLAWSAVTPGAGSVAIYTGTTQWIDKAAADGEAKITNDGLNSAGINTSWFDGDGQMDLVADWVAGVTGNGAVDVLVLYGDLPPTIYPDGNAEPDGTLVESFVESTDGDIVINHADYMFWGLNARNETGGLENVMDIPGITMWDDDTPMTVTAQGAAISPTLAGIGTLQSDRPFHVDELAGDWVAEVTLAQNDTGTRADPIIVRDGDRGRLAPVIQTAAGGEPHGQIDIELITWMLGNFATAVEPEGKAAATWGALKATR